MIGIGFTTAEKQAAVRSYVREHGITKIVAIAPAKFQVDFGSEMESIDWPEVQMYRTYYRLLQGIGKSTLIVLNECLRTQDRSDLNYNCVRHFLAQTTHQMIFQRVPLIDTEDDLMILLDFDTRSRWRKSSFDPKLFRDTHLEIRPQTFSLSPIYVETDTYTKNKYATEKRKLIDGIGLKDPHTIPRNLHLLSGKAKFESRGEGDYVARNTRLGDLFVYKADQYPTSCKVLEFCHNFIDFADFLALSQQTEVEVLVTDLKVDLWYLKRYQAWIQRLNDAQAILSQ